MKVLVDTSVWSLSLRKKGPADHPAVKKLAALLDEGEEVAITGTILQEMLQAFRNSGTAQRMGRYFEAIPILPLGRSEYTAAAAIHRKCAANGIAASTIDCQIAEAAIHHGYTLLTADRDFDRVARHTSLKLA
ncbi:MAG: PIN domain nuclease [Myxococcota bacterium]|nr:PIN domain nuclease [Myxococcota bacterium]